MRRGNERDQSLASPEKVNEPLENLVKTAFGSGAEGFLAGAQDPQRKNETRGLEPFAPAWKVEAHAQALRLRNPPVHHGAREHEEDPPQRDFDPKAGLGFRRAFLRIPAGEYPSLGEIEERDRVILPVGAADDRGDTELVSSLGLPPLDPRIEIGAANRWNHEIGDEAQVDRIDQRESNHR